MPIIDTAPFANIALRFNPSDGNVFPMRDMLRLPSLCHICHRWPSLPMNAPFCEPCITAFAQPVPRCPTCALHLQRLPCHNCQLTPSPLHQCLAAVSYQYPWAQCITRFKFHADAGLAKALAQTTHAFWVNPAHLATLRGQHVVLIDDVMTTGATLYAAARALKAVGVQRITGLVLARTEAPHTEDR